MADNGKSMSTAETSRHDLVRLCAVEVAIALKSARGTRVAAEFLNRHRVDLHIALRVLLHPSQRRRYAN